MSNAAAELARKRWKGVTKAERTRIMSEVSLARTTDNRRAAAVKGWRKRRNGK